MWWKTDMGRNALDRAWEFVGRARIVASADELVTRFGDVISNFGFDRFDCGRTDRRPGQAGGGMLGGRGFDDWNLHYREKQFQLIDPCAKFLFESYDPFSWNDVRANTPSGLADRMWSDARDGGMLEGHLTPIALDDSGLMVRLATPEKQFDPDHRGAIVGLTYTFGLEMHRLRPLPPIADESSIAETAAIALSDRQIECLRWVIDGKSNWEISVILGISEHTVSTHIRSAMAKFGVSTRIQAATAALRLDLLTLA